MLIIRLEAAQVFLTNAINYIITYHPDIEPTKKFRPTLLIWNQDHNKLSNNQHDIRKQRRRKVLFEVSKFNNVV